MFGIRSVCLAVGRSPKGDAATELFVSRMQTEPLELQETRELGLASLALCPCVSCSLLSPFFCEKTEWEKGVGRESA